MLLTEFERDEGIMHPAYRTGFTAGGMASHMLIRPADQTRIEGMIIGSGMFPYPQDVIILTDGGVR